MVATSNVFVESAAREAEARIGKAIRYVITLKNGKRFYCGFDGGIIFDGNRKKAFGGGLDWAITGFRPRANSHTKITLSGAAAGVELGAGHVCDLDHGTHRQWGGDQAVKVELIDALTDTESAELASRRAIAESVARVRDVANARLALKRAEREATYEREFLSEIEATLTPAETAEVAIRMREITAEARRSDA